MGSKKKRKIKLIGIIAIVIAVLIVVGCGSLLFIYKDKIFQNKKNTNSPIIIQPRKEAVDYEASVFMVGDALIHGGVYSDAHQGDGSYDFKPMLQYMKPIISKYDIAYYNQETVLGGTEIGLSSYPRFNSPQEVGDAFLDAGFNMVSLATNHTMDRGEDGVLRSVAYWRNHPDVAASGQWSSYDDRAENTSRIYEKNNIKYAFLSYTVWNNGLPTPYDKDYLNSEYSDDKARADIEAIRDKVDFVIVAMHWGTEYSWSTDWQQEEIANFLSGLGVDLIIGAHPHVVQTVSYINDGRTFVIWSLGNFLSDQLDVDNYTGLAMEVTLRKHVDVEGNTTNTVVNPKAQLVFTCTDNYGYGSKNFRIKTYPTLSDDELRNHDSLYEHYKSIVNERFPDLHWGLTWE